MKPDNVVKEKSFRFGVEIIKLYQSITKNKQEYNLSKQLLRAGTSIGANVEEAIGAQSQKDFLAKISIAYKEARETDYWLRLLLETNYISKEEYDSLAFKIEELIRIIGSIQKTLKQNLQ